MLEWFAGCAMMPSSMSHPIPPAEIAPAGYLPYTVAHDCPVILHKDILQNPKQLQQLVEKVYSLFLMDLRNQRERKGQIDFRLRQ